MPLQILMRKSLISKKVIHISYYIMIGVMIKKFKLSNFAAIMILIAADIGIGYFTLPDVIQMNYYWCKDFSFS